MPGRPWITFWRIPSCENSGKKRTTWGNGKKQFASFSPGCDAESLVREPPETKRMLLLRFGGQRSEQAGHGTPPLRSRRLPARHPLTYGLKTKDRGPGGGRGLRGESRCCGLWLNCCRKTKKPPGGGCSENGAGEATRTPDVHLGKVVLYQLSHVRVPSSLESAPPCFNRTGHAPRQLRPCRWSRSRSRPGSTAGARPRRPVRGPGRRRSRAARCGRRGRSSPARRGRG